MKNKEKAGHEVRLGRRKAHTGFQWVNLSDKDNFEDVGVGWRIILERILQIGIKSVDWIDLAEDRDKRRAVVNTVMSLRLPWNVGSFSTSWGRVSFSRKTLCSQLFGYLDSWQYIIKDVCWTQFRFASILWVSCMGYKRNSANFVISGLGIKKICRRPTLYTSE